MVYCSHCGVLVPDDNALCPRCGAQLYGASITVAPDRDSPYAVVGTWRFFWSMVLLNLPIIGWIFTIVWACGGVYNRNLQRLARAYILFWIVNIIWGLILYFTGLASFDWVSRIFAAL